MLVIWMDKWINLSLLIPETSKDRFLHHLPTYVVGTSRSGVLEWTGYEVHKTKFAFCKLLDPFFWNMHADIRTYRPGRHKRRIRTWKKKEESPMHRTLTSRIKAVCLLWYKNGRANYTFWFRFLWSPLRWLAGWHFKRSTGRSCTVRKLEISENALRLKLVLGLDFGQWFFNIGHA